MFPKGDIPHIRYLFDKKTHLAYRRLMKTLNSTMPFETSDVAKFRLHVIEFSDRHGVKATLDAFNVKRSTFFYWKKKYKDSGKRLISLVPKSTRPKTSRKMEVDWRLIAFIKEVRKEYGNQGARIIKPFLDEYALSLDISPIGRTTIEKVIRRRRFTFETRTKAKRKTKYAKLRTRKSPKVKTPGYIEVDTIEIRLFGKKYYFISLIDVFTRYAQVELIKRQATYYTKKSFIRFQHYYQYQIHSVQTDNGSEFLKLFHKYLAEQEIKHIFIYPNSPKINGVVERFNRTVQEEFINRSVDFGVDNHQFQRKLIKYLIWYNQRRPHSSLNYQSPMQFMQTRV
jgi:transposase InsO family protein